MEKFMSVEPKYKWKVNKQSVKPFEKHHPDILKELEKMEKEKNEKAHQKQQHHLYKRSETERQLSLTECVGKKMYDVKSEKYKITKKLAIFIGSTSVPYSIVESQEFKDLVHELDMSYKVPSQSALSKQLNYN